MDYSITSIPLDNLQCDCVVVGIFQNQQLTAAAEQLDRLYHGVIKHSVGRGELKGKPGETVLLNTIPGSKIERILLVGLGNGPQISAKDFKKALVSAANSLKKPAIHSVSCCLTECEVTDRNLQWKTRQTIEAFGDASYQFTQLKSDKTMDSSIEKLIVVVAEDQQTGANTGLIQGKAIAAGVALTKHLADLPGNICTPSFLAEQAIALSQQKSNISVEILGEPEMTELGMGALLSVSRGSRQQAALITLSYQGAAQDAKPVVLIGKGLTFDAGGISLKPAAGMDEMKYDMCGGATVLGTILAAAEMQLPLNIIGLIPSSENLPDGDANKPGDIVTSMSGKTIEILNTDAEGRLLLCDTLTYAERFHPEVVVDIATLTGACGIALGRVVSGLLGNNDDLCAALTAAGDIANDPVWRLPLWDDYQEQLKSNFADVANVGGKDAGTITAACFLSRFAEAFSWAHLDIAATAWRSGQNKGATGRPVPLLAQFLIDRTSSSQ